MLPVASWDHLSSKALIRDVPDRVFVWNHTQEQEAMTLHGVPADRMQILRAAFDATFRDPEAIEEAARMIQGRRVAPHVKALVVPGSQDVARAAEAEGLHEVFRASGFEWRLPGCSMCLAMNPDKLSGRQVCASSSNRNFKGRQGSPSGRTLLMSPAMVAAAAIEGAVVDVRNLLSRAAG